MPLNKFKQGISSHEDVLKKNKRCTGETRLNLGNKLVANGVSNKEMK